MWHPFYGRSFQIMNVNQKFDCPQPSPIYDSYSDAEVASCNSFDGSTMELNNISAKCSSERILAYDSRWIYDEKCLPPIYTMQSAKSEAAGTWDNEKEFPQTSFAEKVESANCTIQMEFDSNHPIGDTNFDLNPFSSRLSEQYGAQEQNIDEMRKWPLSSEMMVTGLDVQSFELDDELYYEYEGSSSKEEGDHGASSLSASTLSKWKSFHGKTEDLSIPSNNATKIVDQSLKDKTKFMVHDRMCNLNFVPKLGRTKTAPVIKSINELLLNPYKNSECVFCKGNNQTEEVYLSHPIRSDNIVVCPYLRNYVCGICKATGDAAHTIKYCPFNKRGFYAMREKFPPPNRSGFASQEQTNCNGNKKIKSAGSTWKPKSFRVDTLPLYRKDQNPSMHSLSSSSMSSASTSTLSTISTSDSESSSHSAFFQNLEKLRKHPKRKENSAVGMFR